MGCTRGGLSTYAHVGVVLSQEAEVVPPFPRIGLSCFLLGLLVIVILELFRNINYDDKSRSEKS